MVDDDIDIARKLIVDHIAVRLVIALKQELKSMDKVVTGDTAESIQYYPELKAVASELKHVLDIEYGMPPRTLVSVGVLQRWAMNKFGYDEIKAREVAYAVHKKIYDQGIEESRYIKATVEKFDNT